MKTTIVPFTKENYPKGYSRKDCQEALAITEAQIDGAKAFIKRLEREAKTLRRELKQGGQEIIKAP